MTSKEKLKRQKMLNDLIYSLSEKILDDPEINYYTSQLLNIYSNFFRHNYSDLYPVVMDINDNDNEIYCSNYLLENLSNISDHIEKEYTEGNKQTSYLYKPLTKLFDHINLEIARMQNNSNDSKLKDLSANYLDLNSKIKMLNINIENASDKVSSIHMDVISILSIFSAIVIAFFGGINFISSAITSISNTPLKKVVFVILICGIVIFNTLFVLLYLISKIIKKNIYAKCKTENCTCGENNTPKCNLFRRIRKRLPYVYYGNLIFLFLLLLDSLYYIFTLFL